VYSFHADLHLNPFGSHPRLSRGLVLHGKKGDTTATDAEHFGGGIAGDGCSSSSSSSVGWFRPVVATFEGIGIGRDSADLSYRSRRRRR
jgi:hypothetical protein